MNLSNALTIRRLKLIEAAITYAPKDYKEVAAATHTSEAYALRCMGELLDMGKVRVVEWRLCARVYAAVYLWGPGESAPRPKPMVGREGQHAYRARIRSDPIRNAFHLAKERAKDRVRRARKKPQTWLSALMPVSAGKSTVTGKPAEQ